MAMNFDTLLRSIHPAVTLDRFEREADAAVLSMPTQPRPPRDARELMLRLAALQHRMSRPVGDRTPFPMDSFDLYARLVNQLLTERRGFRGRGGRGIGVAYQSVVADGMTGYRGVIDKLVRNHVYTRTQLTVRRRVDRYWKEQDAQGRILAAKFYLARFKSLLTPDQRRRDPVRLATVLPGVLYEHPFRLRSILGSERLRR